jgi:hypothetical protein
MYIDKFVWLFVEVLMNFNDIIEMIQCFQDIYIFINIYVYIHMYVCMYVFLK